MTFDYTHLGDLLKEARETANMKQSEVAELIGCTASNVSSWERAKSKIDIESLVLLCNIYEINFSELMNKVHTKQSSDFTNTEKKIIKKYRTLDNYGQEAVDKILDVEYKRCTNQDNLIPSLVAARSKNNDEPIHMENVPDLSKLPIDDSDL